MKKHPVTIIIPVHNGETYLMETVKTVTRELGKRRYEIIIAEDGSQDGTARVAKNLMKSNANIRLITDKKKKGKGKAVEDAIRAAKGDIIFYVDVDNATNISAIRGFLKHAENADIVVGSRHHPGSKTERGLVRGAFSEAYNLLVRTVLGSKVMDHQCGFKALRRKSAMRILPMIRDKHWFWDTEMLVIAQRKGLKVKEVPVEWKEGKDSTVRLISDSWYMLVKVFEMRCRHV
ncbi:MAG: glycosyltransferase [Candidatus Bilamarchaeaceae archaeon]